MSILADSMVPAWGIAALMTAGVITRPFRLPEAVWAVAAGRAGASHGCAKLIMRLRRAVGRYGASRPEWITGRSPGERDAP